MAEIKNPEGNLKNTSAKLTPAQMRVAELQKQERSNELDADGKIGEKRAEIERDRFSRSEKAENKEKTWERNLDAELDNASNVKSDKEMKDNPREWDSKFSKESFQHENSYDARVSKEIRELAKKGVSDLVPMGGDASVKRDAKGVYSADEITALKTERERIEAPNRETIMQKVIGVDTGNPQKDLSSYLNPTDKNGAQKNADVYGFVSKAEDSTPYTHTPKECYENLRLDYEKTNYINPNQSVYVMRFTDGKNYDIPYSEQFGGNYKDAQPCTGNGYLGSDHHLIPEYKVRPEENHGAIITDGTIYRINPDGTEIPMAYYNRKHRCFKLYEMEVKP